MIVWTEELIWLGCATYSYCFYNDFFEYKNNNRKTVSKHREASLIKIWLVQLDTAFGTMEININLSGQPINK